MSIISFTSDIGHKDYLSGAFKGRMLAVDPTLQVVDISHDVTPYNYNEAVYFLNGSYPHFPPFSWHIIMVNVFDSAKPQCLLAFHNGHYFAAPDNGLLPMICGKTPEQVIVLPIAETKSAQLLAWAAAIATAISSFNKGTAFHRLGQEATQLVEKHSLRPRHEVDSIEGRIIFIDRFENVIVNITREEFEAARRGRNFYIAFKNNEKITGLVDHYGMVPEGDKLAFFNTAGYLEIAVNKGNVAGLFGLQAIQNKASEQLLQSRLFYQSVRIFFTND